MLSRMRCLVTGHKWLRVKYAGSPDGFFLRCKRCGKETDDAGTAVPFL